MPVVHLDDFTVLLFGHITLGPFLWSDTKLSQSTHRIWQKQPCVLHVQLTLTLSLTLTLYSTVAVAEESADGDKFA
jgi:uncharacterized protein (DUF983 family)